MSVLGTAGWRHWRKERLEHLEVDGLPPVPVELACRLIAGCRVGAHCLRAQRLTVQGCVAVHLQGLRYFGAEATWNELTSTEKARLVEAAGPHMGVGHSDQGITPSLHPLYYPEWELDADDR